MKGSGRSNIIPFPTSFQNSIPALYYYRAPVQPALGPLCARCSMNQCFVLFAGSEQSMCNDADIIFSSQTELAGCDEWQIRIKMECECDVIKGLSTHLSFFYFLLCLFYHFKWQTVSNLFIFSAALFTVLTVRC